MPVAMVSISEEDRDVRIWCGHLHELEMCVIRPHFEGYMIITRISN